MIICWIFIIIMEQIQFRHEKKGGLWFPCYMKSVFQTPAAQPNFTLSNPSQPQYFRKQVLLQEMFLWI